MLYGDLYYTKMILNWLLAGKILVNGKRQVMNGMC